MLLYRKKITLIILVLLCFAGNSYSQFLHSKLDSANYFLTTYFEDKDSISTLDYWLNIKNDNRLYITSLAEYEKHKEITTFKNPRLYSAYVFSLKYNPNHPKIDYSPSYVSNNFYSHDEGYIDEMEKFDHLSSKFPSAPNIDKAADNYYINHPELVMYDWDVIPSMLLDKSTRLSRRNADKILKNLAKEASNVNTNTNLSKIVEKTGPWVLSGTESLQFSQTHLTNWTKGGESSFSINSDLWLRANYNKNKVSWDNYVRQQLGILNTEENPFLINNDQFEMNSKFGLRASEKWYYSIVYNLKSQFFNGYSDQEKTDLISKIFSPAYLSLSLGMDFKPSNNFTLLISPLTAKITYIADTAKINPTTLGVEEGKKSNVYAGASVVNSFNWVISTEASLGSNLNAFMGYGTNSDLYQVDWEMYFRLRINQYLSTQLNFQMRYFTNESYKWQLREYWSVAFNYNF